MNLRCLPIAGPAGGRADRPPGGPEKSNLSAGVEQGRARSPRGPGFLCSFGAPIRAGACGRSGWRPPLRLVGWLLLALAPLTAGAAEVTPAAGAVEYKVKAGYLFHFTRFVEWPAAAQPAPGRPFVIAVLGDEAAARTIAQVLAGKTVDGRPLEVQTAAHDAVPRHAQILFATRSTAHPPGRLRQELGGAPVLLVGETARFAAHGGTIGFVAEEDRILLEICLEHAAAAGLKISAKLASVARLVKPAPPEPP
ncbi:MAG: YfiR family protein [Verrucomicrobia bacterium]|nr:YfiR family protein [Verrucomicrobiota bacterium]